MIAWNYPRCFVVGVHDGDTISVDIDFGQQFWTKGRTVRLAGIAALELREPGGIEARDYLASRLLIGSPVSIESTGWDKYAGRIDGWVRIMPTNELIQSTLVEHGFAVPWDGHGGQPKPRWPRREEAS